MRSGCLNHLAAFMEPGDVIASDGSISKLWYSQGTARCEMNPVPSSQGTEGGKQDVMQCRIRMRYRLIKPTYRLIIEGQTWAILSIEVSPDRKEMMLLCESATTLDGTISEPTNVSVVMERMKNVAVISFLIEAVDLNSYNFHYYEGVHGLDISNSERTIEQMFAEIAGAINAL